MKEEKNPDADGIYESSSTSKVVLGLQTKITTIFNVQNFKTFPKTSHKIIYEYVVTSTLFQTIYLFTLHNFQKLLSLSEIWNLSISKMSKNSRRTCSNKYINRKFRNQCPKSRHHLDWVDGVPEKKEQSVQGKLTPGSERRELEEELQRFQGEIRSRLSEEFPHVQEEYQPELSQIISEDPGDWMWLREDRGWDFEGRSHDTRCFDTCVSGNGLVDLQFMIVQLMSLISKLGPMYSRVFLWKVSSWQNLNHLISHHPCIEPTQPM